MTTTTLLSTEGLNDAERALLEAAATGKLIDLRTGDPETDNPANAANWDASREIRAEFLAELLTGDRAPGTGRLRSVKLCGARITGPLDMEARTFACPLLLQGCYIEQPVNFNEATASAIRLPGSHLPALTARQLRTTGNVEFTAGFNARGEVDLEGARIGGQFDLSGASLANENGIALNADGLDVGQSMFCREGFTACGEIWLAGAHISGQLTLKGANLRNENGKALIAEWLTVEQSMFCTGGFTARGEVHLSDAHIGGQFFLYGASLTNDHGPALYADGLVVGQGMFCSDDFTASGTVRLISAHMGELSFSGAILTSETGPVLNAYNLVVDQDMTCDEGFTARGEVRLSGARVGGMLDLRRARLENQNGLALNAEGLTTGRNMLCQDLRVRGGLFKTLPSELPAMRIMP